VLVAIAVVFPQTKDFAIDVLVWRNLNHHRTVRGSNIRSAHCYISLLLADAAAVALLPPGPPLEHSRARAGPREEVQLESLTQKRNADNSSPTVSGALNDQQATSTICPWGLNGFLRGVVPG
jgi:hypothetical protein